MDRGKETCFLHFWEDSWLLRGGDLAALRYGVKCGDFGRQSASS